MAQGSIAIDTSAFVAIYRQGTTAQRCRHVLTTAPRILVPGSCYLEAALLRRDGNEFFEWFQAFTKSPIFSIADLSRQIVEIAVDAARKYGKGSGHPAQLNFGDCLSYAVAKQGDLPLLFVGEDFNHTDITPALKPE